MKYILLFSLLLFPLICHAKEYHIDLPSLTQTIKHEYSFGRKELEEIIIKELTRDGDILPEGEMRIDFDKTHDGSMCGHYYGITLSIKECVKIIIIP